MERIVYYTISADGKYLGLDKKKNPKYSKDLQRLYISEEDAKKLAKEYKGTLSSYTYLPCILKRDEEGWTINEVFSTKEEADKVFKKIVRNDNAEYRLKWKWIEENIF